MVAYMDEVSFYGTSYLLIKKIPPGRSFARWSVSMIHLLETFLSLHSLGIGIPIQDEGKREWRVDRQQQGDDGYERC